MQGNVTIKKKNPFFSIVYYDKLGKFSEPFKYVLPKKKKKKKSINVCAFPAQGTDTVA